MLALEHAQQLWEVLGPHLPRQPDVIHEYGCAVGTGLDFLRCELGAKKAIGFDVDFLDRARENAPECEFREVRVQDASEVADIIFVMHLLEVKSAVPEEKPLIIDRLLGLCKYLALGVHHWNGQETQEWLGNLLRSPRLVVSKELSGEEDACGRGDTVLLLRGKLGNG